MKLLIVNTDYPAFLDALYAAHPGLAYRPYDEQLRVRSESLFGVADFYPRNLRELGHEAHEVHLNNRPLQSAWAAEHGVNVPDASQLRLTWRRGVVPWILRDESAWMRDVLAAQVEHFRPDVVLTHAITEFDRRFCRRMRTRCRCLVGQIASPLDPRADLRGFDLMLSSLPNFVERFRAAGLRAELFRLAFDPVVLERFGVSAASINDLKSIGDSKTLSPGGRGSSEGAAPSNPSTDVSFVGTLSAHHADRIHWLEHICRNLPVKVWGQGMDELPAESVIRRSFVGPAWGLDMYRVLRDSRITLNHHIGISERFANNMRLYEATGVGSLLVTDAKDNLYEMFDPGREVVTYRSPEECVERIRYYLDHEDERRQIARAGQQRTLREHTYRRRMEQLASIVGGINSK